MECPHCNKSLNNTLNIGDEPLDKDGRPVLCNFCAEVSITDNKVLRKLTDEDIRLIKEAGW